MAFDKDGAYISGSDKPIRFVQVVQKEHRNVVGAQGAGAWLFRAGSVVGERMMGHTNVAATPTLLKGDAVWIEHATALVGEVLSENEYAPLILDAQKKQVAVRAFHDKLASERAKTTPHQKAS